jgi:hypothetical protein
MIACGILFIALWAVALWLFWKETKELRGKIAKLPPVFQLAIICAFGYGGYFAYSKSGPQPPPGLHILMVSQDSLSVATATHMLSLAGVDKLCRLM